MASLNSIRVNKKLDRKDEERNSRTTSHAKKQDPDLDEVLEDGDEPRRGRAMEARIGLPGLEPHLRGCAPGLKQFNPGGDRWPPVATRPRPAKTVENDPGQRCSSCQ